MYHVLEIRPGRDGGFWAVCQSGYFKEFETGEQAQLWADLELSVQKLYESQREIYRGREIRKLTSWEASILRWGDDGTLDGTWYGYGQPGWPCAIAKTPEQAKQWIDQSISLSEALAACKWQDMSEAQAKGEVGDSVRKFGWGNGDEPGVIEWIGPKRTSMMVRHGNALSWCDGAVVSETGFGGMTTLRMLEQARAWQRLEQAAYESAHSAY
jgi:hypothetical protein